MKRQQDHIETGSVVGSTDVWLGATSGYYDHAVAASSGDRLHILRFSLQDAEAAVKMLKGEISRSKRNAKNNARLKTRRKEMSA